MLIVKTLIAHQATRCTTNKDEMMPLSILSYALIIFTHESKLNPFNILGFTCVRWMPPKYHMLSSNRLKILHFSFSFRFGAFCLDLNLLQSWLPAN